MAATGADVWSAKQFEDWDEFVDEVCEVSL